MVAFQLFRSTFFASLLVLAALLGGCGGGGGAQSGILVDPTSAYHGASAAAVVTSGNAETLALGSFAGSSLGAQLGAIGRAEKSTVGKRVGGLPMGQLVQALKLSTRSLAIPQKAAQLRNSATAAERGKRVGRESRFQVPGDQSGVASYTLQVNDSTGSFYGTVAYQGFTSRGTVTNGSCDLLGSFEPNGQDLAQLTLSFKALNIGTSGGNYQMTGTLSWTYTLASSSDSLTMNAVLKDLSDSKTYWYRDYRVESVYGRNSLSQTISGRYYDHELGYVDMATEGALLAYYGSQWPVQGTLQANSAAGNWVRMRFQSTTYTIEAETNGDGTVDWQEECDSNLTPPPVDPAYPPPVIPTNPPPVNSAPLAQAGPDQSVVLGDRVQLDGRASSDPDGDTLSYTWSLLSLPAGVAVPTLSDANTALAHFVPTTPGTYQFRLRVYDGSSQSEDLVTVVVTAAVPLQPAAVQKTWQFGNYGSSIGEAGLLTTDLDGDGVPEIIASAATGGFGDNVAWYVVKKNASGGYEQVWRSEDYGVTIVKLLLADMNGDGKNDVVVALSNGTVRCYDGPTLKELPTLNAGASLRDLALADLDGDGHQEMVATDGTAIRVYNAETGALKWSKSSCGGASLALGNVDGDAALEIVTTSYGSKGYVIDGVTGAVKWEYLNGFGALVRLADLDADGKKEIVGASAWYKITIFDADLKSPAWEIATDLDIGALLLADTDGDGIPEIIYGDSQWGRIHAVDARSHLERWSVDNPEHGVSGIALGDVDLDGKKELLWGAGGSSTGPDFLFIADPATGTVKWQNLDFAGLSALALGDLEGSGSDQLLMVTADSDNGFDGGIIHVFQAQSHALSYQKGLGIPDLMGENRQVRIGDLNGDGHNEFAVSTASLYDGLIQVYDGATRTLKRQTAGYDGNFFSALALGDVDGDGKMEIIAGQGREHTGAKGVYLIVFDGVTMQEKWKSVDLGSYWGAVYDIKLADLDQDGNQDIVVSLGGSRLIVFDGVTHVMKLMAEAPVRALEVADVDGDGSPEILAGRSDGKIDVYDGVSFAVKKTVSSFGAASVDALKVADLDGQKWLVAGGGVLSILKGQELYWRSGPLGSNLGKGNSIAVKDTDHDGHPNIFIGTNTVLYQFKHVGAVTP